MGGEAIRPTWDVLNGWDRQSATDVAYYQGSTTGDAVQSGANAGDKCRGTGDLVTWHVDRECHTLEASTMDEMCRRMLVISADDMSPDVIPHGARETVVAALTDPREDHPDRAPAASAAPARRRRRPRPTDRSKGRLGRNPHPTPPPTGGVATPRRQLSRQYGARSRCGDEDGRGGGIVRGRRDGGGGVKCCGSGA